MHSFFLTNFYWSIVDLQWCVNSAVQQNESVIHTSTFFRFLPHLGHQRALSRVPCAIQ